MDLKVNSDTTIAFDLDDTLYNEINFLKSAFKQLAFELDPKDWKALYVRMFSMFRSSEDVFSYLTKTYQVTKTILLEKYRAHQPEITPFNGVISLMKKIKEQNASIALITDGRSVTQRNKIKALGIEEFIDFIIISEELGTEKPNPLNFENVENQLKTKKNYYIGDNLKKDFITPKKMGWKTVGLVDNGLNIHAKGKDYMRSDYLPDYFIFNITDINII